MFKRYLSKLIGVALAVGFILLCFNVNINAIFTMPDNCKLSYDDLTIINNDNIFGAYTKSNLSENTFTVGNEKKKTTTLIVKLFGFIPIREVEVDVLTDERVFLGGIPLGFSINTKGVIVIGQNSITTEKGNENVKKSAPIKNGDIITEINGTKVNCAKEIKDVMAKVQGSDVELTILRKNNEFKVTVKPLVDIETGELKLGFWVKNEAQGVGTLTFVNDEDKYGALGHSIIDFETGVEIPVENGNIYSCSLVGINKAEKGKTGELRCLFMQGKNKKGDVSKNTKCGVFGNVSDKEQLVDANVSYQVGSRMVVKMGQAKIISAVSGIREEYDIEIIKTNYQPTANDKSFVFRVKDKRLLDITGGIVQGMSGSPIIQNGKFIGAVTHVFLSDSTKGYGVYADWMIEEAEKGA